MPSDEFIVAPARRRAAGNGFAGTRSSTCRRHYRPVLSKIHRWLVPGGRVMVSSGGLHDESSYPEGFTDTMYGHEFYYDSPSPAQMVSLLENLGFGILVAEMCDLPDGGRNKGKWATVAEKI